LAIAKIKKLWKNEYFQTAIMVILNVAIVFGFWYGLQLALNTQYPMLAVASGSMCTLPGSDCDGWSHPFEPTLHVGDLIVVQRVNPADIRAEPYPYGDIIVFRKPGLPDELIVHRAIYKEESNGKIYFRTKGDGNDYPDTNMVSEDSVIGKVILRVPWIGQIALFMHNSFGVLVIVVVIILLVVELVIPAFTGKENETEPKESVEKAFEA